LPGDCRHFLRTSARCQRNSVCGVTRRAARGAWQVAGRRREQRPIRRAKLRPRDLAAEDFELVAQDQQLEVLDVQDLKGAITSVATSRRRLGGIDGMFFSFVYRAFRALLGLLVRSRRGPDVKDIELMVLRHEFEVAP
jgi:hypothetical protein